MLSIFLNSTVYWKKFWDQAEYGNEICFQDTSTKRSGFIYSLGLLSVSIIGMILEIIYLPSLKNDGKLARNEKNLSKIVRG